MDIVKIKRSILKKIEEHALKGYHEHNSEVIGYLIGQYKESWIEINDLIIPDQQGTNIHAEITSELAIVEYLRKNKRDINNVQVGWYHSHPSLSCFLSQIDIQTQKYWQKVNNRMVALVIDPIKNDVKCFRLDNNDQVYEMKMKSV